MSSSNAELDRFMAVLRTRGRMTLAHLRNVFRAGRQVPQHLLPTEIARYIHDPEQRYEPTKFPSLHPELPHCPTDWRDIPNPDVHSGLDRYAGWIVQCSSTGEHMEHCGSCQPDDQPFVECIAVDDAHEAEVQTTYHNGQEGACGGCIWAGMKGACEHNGN
ncbi:hypothetical protein KCU98_g12568, partial [Aureobasidium melanogenum]